MQLTRKVKEPDHPCYHLHRQHEQHLLQQLQQLFAPAVEAGELLGDERGRCALEAPLLSAVAAKREACNQEACVCMRARECSHARQMQYMKCAFKRPWRE